MKYLMILILIGLVAITSVNGVHGLWVPQSPEELFKQSETVFVGNVTFVKVLEFERSNTRYIEENGVSRIEIENYTQTLDEYTVNIEGFLKNPQESNTITMLEATVSGVPGRSVSIGGFELGDRVLFYVPKIDGTNQYSPESFRIPKQCDAKSVLEQSKITLFNDFKIMQNGIEKNDNFTANKPIEFVYNKDMGTLDGKSFDVNIKISKIIGNDWETALEENIHTESKPCEWISTASWEFVPTAGKYYLWMNISEGDRIDVETSSRKFTVINNSSQNESVFPHHGYQPSHIVSPLKQVKDGVPINLIKCNESLQLEWKRDLQPICVTSETAGELIKRGVIKLRLGMPAEEITQERLCVWYPENPLIQRHCDWETNILFTFKDEGSVPAYDEILRLYAMEKRQLIRDFQSDAQEKYGSEHMWELLPSHYIGYDYHRDALEFGIHHEAFDEESAPKYVEFIRSIVGENVNLTVRPAYPIVPQSFPTGEFED